MSTNERTKAIAEVLAAAGFTAARRISVLARIEEIIEVHNAITLTEPALTVSRARIEKVAQTAEKLRALIDELPRGARYQLFGEEIFYSEKLNPLTALIERARSYQTSVQRGPGKPRNENLRGLLFEFVSLWNDELPSVAGIARDGSGPDDGRDRYKGPLFEFVRSLLDAEGVQYHSTDALGRQLWELWSQRQLADRRHAAGLCSRCQKELADKARGLCEDCLGWAYPKATVQKPS